MTPAMVAVATDKLGVLRLFEKHNANLLSRDNYGRTALHYGCQAGASHCVKVRIFYKFSKNFPKNLQKILKNIYLLFSVYLSIYFYSFFYLSVIVFGIKRI